MNTEPLFILSVPRSYTSLVGSMIGQNPMMYGLPELNLFMASDIREFWSGKSEKDTKFSITWPMMRHGLLRTIAQLYSGEQTIDSIAMAARWLSVRSTMSTGDVYRTICRKVHPLIPVDKSPGYVSKLIYLERIRDAFPRARFIHLVRHPRGQCQSFLNVSGGRLVLSLMGSVDASDSGTVVDPQLAWYRGNKRIVDFLATIPADQQRRVVAEDLLSGLDPGLSAICEWLGLPSGKNEVESMKHPENSVYAHVGPLTARLGNDINFLKNPALDMSIKIKKHSLRDPLPWRPDNKPFNPEVVELAGEFSYT